MTHRPVDLDPVVLVMVGKPARGKSYTARKVARYMTWMGYRARVFNVGAYRRDRLGPGQDHTFFDPTNPQGLAARRRMALEALDDLIAWVQDGGEVAIYDATNSTRRRRQWVRDRCGAEGLQVVFLEIVCEDPTVIEANIRETKVTSPDYRGADPDEAVADFRARLEHYEDVYEPVLDERMSVIRLIDVGRRVELNRIRGYLPGRLVTFLMNLHLTPRPIYLSRHGESEYNLEGLIGGDSSLSPKGQRYAVSLADHVAREVGRDGDLVVWTSTLQRTIQTAKPLKRPTQAWKALDEIDAGVCDGMSYAQIERTLPAEFAARQADKFSYRYPRGESYEDVIARLEPVIVEIERTRRPLLIVAHQAVLRALYAYVTDIPPERCPHLPIPLHTVIELTPKAYGCEETRTPLAPSPEAPSSAST